MRTNVFISILFPSVSISFFLSYIYHITASGWEQYLAITSCIMLDGFFGIIAGIKKEGFKTYKALKIIKVWFAWTLILTVTLITEKTFPNVSWLSETMITPIVVFNLLSALKNAVRSGFIPESNIKKIMDQIDRHKDQ